MSEWLKRASALVDEITEHGDENGAIANASADDLRDALRVATDRLRVHVGKPPRNAWLVGTRWLIAEVWNLVDHHRIDARSPAADAALEMRDMVDTRWLPNVTEERNRIRPER